MSSAAAAGSAGKGWIQPPSPVTAAEMGWRQPFTAAQWRELEHQALIFKYLVAGVPVPADLLIPIQRSLEALPPRFYHHYPHSSHVGYFSYYGKKLDPEPGRCRRTDGKKWRCSKDAHPDSKYCERHMHRSRNRSRKHVESKSSISPQLSQPHFSSSTSTSHVALGSTGSGSFQNFAMQSAMASASKTQDLCSGSSGSSHLQSDSQHYEIGGKEYRYLHEAKLDVDKHNFFSEYPGSIHTDLSVNSSPDNSWGLMPSQVPTFSLSKGKTSHLTGDYSSQLQAMQNLSDITIRSIPKQQEQLHSYFKSDFGLPDLDKQECQGLRPAFNEWIKARESWLDLKDEHSEHNSFSATQLSISIPMASSDFSTTTCCSPNDD